MKRGKGWWFAWRPVRMPDGKIAWLKWVRRKRKVRTTSRSDYTQVYNTGD